MSTHVPEPTNGSILPFAFRMFTGEEERQYALLRDAALEAGEPMPPRPPTFDERLSLYVFRHVGSLEGGDSERYTVAVFHLHAIDRARKFPSLRGAPGCTDEGRWSPFMLDAWAAPLPAGHPGRHAARCVLAATVPGVAWSCGDFSPSEALAVWDAGHREAFEALAASRPGLRDEPAPESAERPFTERLAAYVRRHGARLLGDSEGERVAMAAECLNHIDLARKFPSLRNAPGCSEGAGWGYGELDKWAAALPDSHPGRHAARFVLAVVHQRSLEQFDCGRFSPSVALAVWDAEHRAAFEDVAKGVPWVQHEPRDPVFTSGVNKQGLPYWKASHERWTIVATWRRGIQRLTVTPAVVDTFDPPGPLCEAMAWLEQTDVGCAWLGSAKPEGWELEADGEV